MPAINFNIINKVLEAIDNRATEIFLFMSNFLFVKPTKIKRIHKIGLKKLLPVITVKREKIDRET